MKLKEGMYVRTKYGIAKITNIVCGQDVHFDNEKLENISPYDGISKDGTYWRENIIGEPSFNLIDLIEIGDYVNGVLITNISEDNKGKYVFGYSKDGFEGEIWFYNNEIETIVTKEQFSQMEYKVGE